jgi:hypothetical protein
VAHVPLPELPVALRLSQAPLSPALFSFPLTVDTSSFIRDSCALAQAMDLDEVAVLVALLPMRTTSGTQDWMRTVINTSFGDSHELSGYMAFRGRSYCTSRSLFKAKKCASKRGVAKVRYAFPGENGRPKSQPVTMSTKSSSGRHPPHNTMSAKFATAEMCVSVVVASVVAPNHTADAPVVAPNHTADAPVVAATHAVARRPPARQIVRGVSCDVTTSSFLPRLLRFQRHNVLPTTFLQRLCVSQLLTTAPLCDGGRDLLALFRERMGSVRSLLEIVNTWECRLTITSRVACVEFCFRMLHALRLATECDADVLRAALIKLHGIARKVMVDGKCGVWLTPSVQEHVDATAGAVMRIRTLSGCKGTACALPSCACWAQCGHRAQQEGQQVEVRPSRAWRGWRGGSGGGEPRRGG